MADQRQGVDSASIGSARALIAAAPYASLALWGGRVVHGVRFSTAAESVPDASSAGPMVVRGRHPGVPPAHPTAGSTTASEPVPVSPVVDGARVPASVHLLLLAPTAAGQWPQIDDLAARLNLSGSAPGSSRWVSVALGGWVAALPAEASQGPAVRFAERHPTPNCLILMRTG
jgi:hypothetical protein